MHDFRPPSHAPPTPAHAASGSALAQLQTYLSGGPMLERTRASLQGGVAHEAVPMLATTSTSRRSSRPGSSRSLNGTIMSDKYKATMGMMSVGAPWRQKHDPSVQHHTQPVRLASQRVQQPGGGVAGAWITTPKLGGVPVDKAQLARLEREVLQATSDGRMLSQELNSLLASLKTLHNRAAQLE